MYILKNCTLMPLECHMVRNYCNIFKHLCENMSCPFELHVQVLIVFTISTCSSSLHINKCGFAKHIMMSYIAIYRCLIEIVTGQSLSTCLLFALSHAAIELSKYLHSSQQGLTSHLSSRSALSFSLFSLLCRLQSKMWSLFSNCFEQWMPSVNYVIVLLWSSTHAAYS